MDHSLLKWIVGDMSGWPPIGTEIAEMAERFLDHPLSRKLVGNALLARKRNDRPDVSP